MVNERDKFGRFVKGMKPWHTGTKGIFKATNGCFKKGNIPWNKDTIGLQTSNKKGKNFEEIYGDRTEKIKSLIKIGRAKQITPIKDTKIEIKIQNFLKQLGIEFFTHHHMNIKHSYQCDILIPSMNLVVECDGTYWHRYPIGRDIDHIRTSELIGKGFRVLRLWEFEINKMTIDKFKGILLK